MPVRTVWEAGIAGISTGSALERTRLSQWLAEQRRAQKQRRAPLLLALGLRH